MDDQELLRQYVERQSEKAFADLVTRHIDMVYSAALRIVQDPGLAKDVTQSVFIRLAQKAPVIRSGHALPGWLYRVACGQAANAVRDERTRQEREKEAMTMKSTEEDTNAAWRSILPHLDDAMSKLKATEQNALVLRFFEGRSWREVGAALSLNEDTAQKRVSRAIDKLRLHFQRHGIVLSTVAVASVISANAAQAAPAGLASTVASVSLTHATGAGIFSLTSTYLHALIMKKNFCVVLLIVLASAVIIPVSVSRARKSQSNANTSIGETSIRRGLVLDYKFDHNPGNGQIIDASGAGNNGQVTGAQWTSDPQRGSVLQLSPPNQYILVPNSLSLNPSNLTLAAWIKTNDQGDTWRRVFDKGWTNGFALSIAGGHTHNNRTQGDAVIEIATKYSARSDQAVTDGQWHHVAVTYNGAEQILYLDGVPQKHVVRWLGSVPSNDHDLTIGINLVDPNPQYNEVGASFDGLIDEPMMFNRALSAGEIKFLFNSQRK
jgi:RNA polymerase sigma factor (sigma-70 family)